MLCGIATTGVDNSLSFVKLRILKKRWEGGGGLEHPFSKVFNG